MDEVKFTVSTRLESPSSRKGKGLGSLQSCL